MAGIDVKYDEELVKSMQNTFINKIVPDTFLVLIHTINPGVLTMADVVSREMKLRFVICMKLYFVKWLNCLLVNSSVK